MSIPEKDYDWVRRAVAENFGKFVTLRNRYIEGVWKAELSIPDHHGWSGEQKSHILIRAEMLIKGLLYPREWTMPKFSEYSKSLRGQILDMLHKTEERARNYEESCRSRGMYNTVSRTLSKSVECVRSCIKTDLMTDSSICFLIGAGLDEFADELWGDAGVLS